MGEKPCAQQRTSVHSHRRVLKRHVLDSKVLQRLPHLVLRHPAQPSPETPLVEVGLALDVTLDVHRICIPFHVKRLR